jgi:hypothetical protein
MWGLSTNSGSAFDRHHSIVSRPVWFQYCLRSGKIAHATNTDTTSSRDPERPALGLKVAPDFSAGL